MTRGLSKRLISEIYPSKGEPDAGCFSRSSDTASEDSGSKIRVSLMCYTARSRRLRSYLRGVRCKATLQVAFVTTSGNRKPGYARLPTNPEPYYETRNSKSKP